MHYLLLVGGKADEGLLQFNLFLMSFKDSMGRNCQQSVVFEVSEQAMQ